MKTSMINRQFASRGTSKVQSMLMVLMLVATLAHHSSAAYISANVIASNLCTLITPEPVVSLSNYFNTQDIFFPSTYTERRCGPSTSTFAILGLRYPTCLKGKYLCVTRYRVMEFIRIPHTVNATMMTFLNSPTVKVRVPVACECSDYTVT